MTRLEQAVGWLSGHPGSTAEEVAVGIGMPRSHRFVFDLLAAAEGASVVVSERRRDAARVWRVAEGVPLPAGRVT